MYEQIRYEQPAPGVARITLACGATHNAQGPAMLYEINDAFYEASQDDDVKVIILAADGKNFSSGHDLACTTWQDTTPVTCWGSLTAPGAEGYMALEQEVFLQMCWRWRNLPKPTVAAVQGRAIAGGLMLAWVCDLIVASDDALFSDPVVAFGLNGHEYFVHVFEMGARRAKELLFTAESITAQEAKGLGMVSQVVPREELAAAALVLAQKIARLPSMGLRLAKQSVNQSQDAQGLWTALQAAFSLHQLGHSNNMQLHDMVIDPAGIDFIKSRGKSRSD